MHVLRLKIGITTENLPDRACGHVSQRRKGAAVYMNKEEIMQIIPHRDHMLLIDEAEVRDGIAYGKKKITGDEFFLKGHFPGDPVVPGVILCEIMAQSVCACFTKDTIGDGLPFLTGMDKVKFRHPVKPGDTFETKCEIVKTRLPFYFTKCSGYVNGHLSVSAEISFAVVK